MRAWLKEHRGEPGDLVFPNQQGRSLTHGSLDYLLAKNLAIAQTQCPSLKKKRATPHCLRHTAAMPLLHSGVDRAVIALWLGHESVETTYVYLHADLELKEKAMARTAQFGLSPIRYRPDDDILAFLCRGVDNTATMAHRDAVRRARPLHRSRTRCVAWFG